MKVGSLFSGIGGLDLGLERAGMEVCWQCEIDKAAQSVLGRRFPDATIYDDVTTLGGTSGRLPDSQCLRGRHTDADTARASGRGADTTHIGAERVDLICGGFPCQDLSVAGRRAGLAGERSGLWYHFHRILGELAPRWVLVENVPGLLSSNQGRDFAVVLRGLVELGYGVAWRILDAQYFGVAQRRRRVFIVGCLGDRRSAAQVLFEPESLPGNPAPSREAGERVTALTSCGVGTCGADDNQAQGGHLVAQFDGHSANGIQERVGDANTLDGDGRDGVIVTHALTAEGHDASEDGTGRGGPLVMAPAYGTSDKAPHVSQGMSVRRLTPTECERLQGFPDGWTDGQSDSARYRQLGNAVCVNVAEWIGRRIMAVAS